MATGSNTGRAKVASSSTDSAIKRHAIIAQLVALARDMLDGDREQIVGDYLNHAVDALNRVRESAMAERHWPN